MICEAKHTKFQPSDDDWKCPKCGATARSFPNAFIIEEEAEGSDGDCTTLHDDDVLRCGCGYSVRGKAYAARLRKQANMVKCPTCNGHGIVKGTP